MKATDAVDYEAEDMRFQRKLDLGLGSFLLFIAILSIVAWLNLMYGTGWDPLNIRGSLEDSLSFALLVILVAVSAAFGTWKLTSALLPVREPAPHGK